jgi:Ca2+-dependent lipid-binding protein
MLSFIILITGLFIFFLGFITRRYRLAMLISGYNTAPRHVKDAYDTEKLTRLVGNLLMMSSLPLIIGGVFMFFLAENTVLLVSWSLFFLIITAGLVYLNTGGRVMKN